MAQPSESSPSRPLSEHLDSSSVELHAPPAKEQQEQQRQHQQRQDFQQRLAPRREDTRQPPYTGDLSTSKSCTHPVGNAARHVPGGDEEGTLDGGSAANAQPSNRAPNSGSVDWIETEVYPRRNGTRYNGDTLLLASPPMSNTQPPPGPRQSVGYPSPTSYPPAGMPPTAHYAFAPQQGLPPDHYRQAPTSLPSMRTLDHVPSQQQQQQPQHPQQHAMSMNSHLGPAMPPGPPIGYYNVPPHAYGIHADPNAMRFAIAPGMADPRIALSGGRHKKVPVQCSPSSQCVPHEKLRC